MKKLILSTTTFFMMSALLFSCSKENIQKVAEQQETKVEQHKELGDNSDEVRDILIAAGFGDVSGNYNEKARDPDVEVLEGKWDGDMNSADINCLNKNTICGIIVTGIAEQKDKIILPNDGDDENPIVIDAVVHLEKAWESKDDRGNTITHYPYEKY